MKFRAHMKFTGYAVIMLIFLVISTIVPIYAQGEGQGEQMKKEKEKSPQFREKEKALGEKLKLSPEQSERLKTIRDKFEWKREDLIFRMKEKKLEMIRLIREDNPDRKEIEKKLDEITKLEGERQKLFLDEYFEVRKELNPDQIRKFTQQTVRSLLR